MLQALLEERFHLKTHRETEEAPIYALTVAKGGLKLKPMEKGGCIASFDPKTHPSFFRPGEKLPCGMIQDDRGPNGTTVIIDAAGVGLDRIARSLSGFLDRYVVDKTGVTGAFNVHLEFAQDENVASPPGAPPIAPSDASAGPTVFTAMEQLGLKLVSDKGPRGFIVIDHVEKPSENRRHRNFFPHALRSLGETVAMPSGYSASNWTLLGLRPNGTSEAPMSTKFLDHFSATLGPNAATRWGEPTLATGVTNRFSAGACRLLGGVDASPGN
jgi:uncharacterized protein (TIGR03435 family)